MSCSDLQLKLKKDSELTKEIFNSNGWETCFKHIKEMIVNSKNDSGFFVGFLEFYYKSRP